MQIVSVEKRLIDELVEECSENIDVVKITRITLAEDETKCKSSCTIYVVLTAIIFTISIGIGIYFIYYKWMNRDKKKLPLDMIMSIKQQIININGKYQTN